MVPWPVEELPVAGVQRQALSSVTPSLGPPRCLMQAMGALGSSLTTSSQLPPLQFTHSLFLLGSYSWTGGQSLYQGPSFKMTHSCPPGRPPGQQETSSICRPLSTHCPPPPPQGSSSHSFRSLCSQDIAKLKEIHTTVSRTLSYDSNLTSYQLGPLSNGLWGEYREGTYFPQRRAHSTPRSSLHGILSSLPDTAWVIGWRI